MKNIKTYKLFEKSISDLNAQKYDTVLRNLNNKKEVSLYIKDLILQLKDECSNLKNIKFTKPEIHDDIIYLLIRYNTNCQHLIQKIINILEESEELDVYQNYYNIVYPDGEENDFYLEINIESDNLNRIHIPVGLPYILKGLGLGKKIYKSLITKYKYISSNYLDRSMESLFVWNSLRKEKDIYTFIFNQKIIGISTSTSFEEIVKILLNFYRGLSDENIIMDDDFKDKYIKEILKSDILFLHEYEIKQSL